MTQQRQRSQQGIETGRLGQWLRGHLDGLPNKADLVLFYDHGDRTASLDVAAVHGVCGEKVENLTRLAEIDLLVAAGSEAILLVEVEERPLAPKKLLGDVLATLMCNQCAVKSGRTHRYFTIGDKTRLIVAGLLPERGRRLRKIEEIIWPRLSQMKGIPHGLDTANVEFVFRPTLEEALEAVRQRAKDFIAALPWPSLPRRSTHGSQDQSHRRQDGQTHRGRC
jgi:hypothetical protein